MADEEEQVEQPPAGHLSDPQRHNFQSQVAESSTIQRPGHVVSPLIPLEHIFRDLETGEPLKFFIQRDTGKNFITWLSDTITKHGGIVVNTVPLKGYVLIDPVTESGERLRKRWETSERPQRHIICYTFVRASIVAGKRLEPQSMLGAVPFFRHENQPLSFHIHPSIPESVLSPAAVEIEKYGGITGNDEKLAKVIIAPRGDRHELVLWKDLVKHHEEDEDKCIEDLSWVKKCIEDKSFTLSEHRRTDLGGRRAGAKRTEYTADDDQNLVKYIAERIPHPEAGGRLGNNLYIYLSKHPKTYPWSTRHSWHSWRNRYKSRQLIFDVAVKQHLKDRPAPPREVVPRAKGKGAADSEEELDSASGKDGNGSTENDGDAVQSRTKNRKDQPPPTQKRARTSKFDKSKPKKAVTRKRIVISDSEEDELNSNRTPVASESDSPPAKRIRHRLGRENQSEIGEDPSLFAESD